MNNRKQQIESFFNKLTSKEIQDYIESNKLNIEVKGMLAKIGKAKPESHSNRLVLDITEEYNNAISKFYKIGNAYIIAFILNCFYDDKYKINDIKYYLKEMIDRDLELKEYTYEIMKDME